MIRFRQDLNDSGARALLRRLRDVCVGPCGIELSAGERVRLLDCQSADQPVESGVRFGLERTNGRRAVLGIRHRDGELRLRLCDDRPGEDATLCELALDLERDRFGRVSAPEVGARLDLETCEPRDIEHFLRRMVRALLDQPAAS